MRIDDKNMSGVGASNLSGAQGTQGAERSRSGAQRGVGGSGSPDHVQLSGLAEQLQSLQSGSEAHEAELSRLRELVQSGRYEVDAEQVSRSLVEEALTETASDKRQGSGS